MVAWERAHSQRWKSEAMIVCRDRNQLVHPLPVLSLDEEVIPYSRNVKNLGIIMDERFSWCDQAKVVRRYVGFVLTDCVILRV
jgi:hypothetical protein